MEWVINDNFFAVVAGNGLVTALRPGKFTIQAKTYYKNKKNNAKIYTAESEKMTITVVNVITEAKAIKPNQLSIEFGASVENLMPNDFVIKDTKNDLFIPAKSVKASEDSTVYAIDLVTDMTSGTSYEVSVKGMTRSFDYVKGTPSFFRVNDQIVTAGKSTPVAFQVLDANGLDLIDEERGKCTMTATHGTVDGLSLTLSKNETASVQLTYTDDSDPQNIKTFTSNQVTITGAAPKEMRFLDGTIDWQSSTSVDFTAPITTIPVGASGKTLFVRLKDDLGNTYIANESDDCRVTLSSLNPAVLMVTNYGELIPLSTGTTQIVVKDISESLLGTVNVTVNAASVDTELAVPPAAQGSLTNATEGNPHNLNTITIDVQIKDQYGESVPVGTRDIEITHESGDTTVTYLGQSLSDPSNVVKVKNGSFSLQPTSPGQEKIKLTCGTLSQIITIFVSAADSETKTYEILGTKTLNIAKAYDESAQGESSAIFTLYSKNVKRFYIDQLPFNEGGFVLKVTDSDDKEVPITLAASGNEYYLTDATVRGLHTGDYTVKAYDSTGTELVEASFSVIDTSESPTVLMKAREIENERITLSSIAKCLIIPAGFSLTGFKFTSTEDSAVMNVSGFVTEVPVYEEYTGSSFPLTLTEVLLTRRSSGRRYALTVSEDITIRTPSKDNVTPLQKLSRFVSEAEKCILFDKTTASADTFITALNTARMYLFESEETGYVEADHTTELVNAFTALKTAKDNLRTANVTVVLSANPAGACNLIGDGKYEDGDTIEISAYAKEGYVFDAWYQNGAFASASPSFSFTAGSVAETISYEARFTQYTDKKKLTVNADGSHNVTCDALETETDISGRRELEFTTGTFVTLTANVAANEVFHYWLDENTNKVLHMGPTYSFYLMDAMNIKACYGTTTGDTFTVVFKDINGNVLSTEEVASGDSATAPTNLGYFTGLTFAGWDADFSQVTSDMIITARYQADDNYTVTVTNGTILNEKVSYVYGDAVTVKADDATNGTAFIGWYQNNQKVSDAIEYTFYLVEPNTSVEARYAEQSVTVSEPLLTFTMSDRSSLENGKQAIALNTLWNVPTSYTFMEAGFVYLIQNGVIADESKLTTDNVGIDGVKKRTPSTLSEEGTYSYTMTLSTVSKSKNLYAKGFLTYINDATGEIKTKYSDLKASDVN